MNRRDALKAIPALAATVALDPAKIGNRAGYTPVGFVHAALGAHWNVTCDGRPLNHCFAADDELGIAWCYDLTPRGTSAPTAPSIIRHHGDVRITPKTPSHA